MQRRDSYLEFNFFAWFMDHGIIKSVYSSFVHANFIQLVASSVWEKQNKTKTAPNTDHLKK